MKVFDFDNHLDRVPPEIKDKVIKVIRCLYNDAINFEEMTNIIECVQQIVKEQIKKADTNEFG